MLAALVCLPQATFVAAAEIVDSKAAMGREVDGGVQHIR